MSVQTVKARVRKRDGGRCVDCGANPSYRAHDVHRLKPGSVYTVRGCVTVCVRCHKKRHGGEMSPAAIARARRQKPIVARRLITGRFHRDVILALEALAERNRRPVTTELEIAAERLLESEGLWPPTKDRKK